MLEPCPKPQWNSVITNSVITNTRLWRTLDYNKQTFWSHVTLLLHKSTWLKWNPVITNKFCRSRAVCYNQNWLYILDMVINTGGLNYLTYFTAIEYWPKGPHKQSSGILGLLKCLGSRISKNTLIWNNERKLYGS